jgi:hypothetical protein
VWNFDAAAPATLIRQDSQQRKVSYEQGLAHRLQPGLETIQWLRPPRDDRWAIGWSLRSLWCIGDKSRANPPFIHRPAVEMLRYGSKEVAVFNKS